jgi:hypothetical protein
MPFSLLAGMVVVGEKYMIHPIHIQDHVPYQFWLKMTVKYGLKRPFLEIFEC